MQSQDQLQTEIQVSVQYRLIRSQASPILKETGTAADAVDAQNPAYLQVEAMITLKSMATDPAAKIYFLNSDSPSPLPLMHIGETK